MQEAVPYREIRTAHSQQRRRYNSCLVGMLKLGDIQDSDEASFIMNRSARKRYDWFRSARTQLTTLVLQREFGPLYPTRRD